MKKFIKNNLKICLTIIITSIVCIGGTVYASVKYFANDISFTPKNSNWNVKNVGEALDALYNLALNNEVCDETPGKTWEYDYINSFDFFIVPCDGKYKVELWGAQGGYNNGYGGYATGVINLKYDDLIYLYVGGKGAKATGGYNGGGSGGGNTGYGGGGATHLSFKRGILSSLSSNIDQIIAVAGGGSGGDSWSSGAPGASAGGYIGVAGTITTDNRNIYSKGGSQTAGGTHYSSGYTSQNGSFGQGGNSASKYGGGGGGGFYGGGGGGASDSWCGSGGGGSSYIGNPLLTEKSMYCYNCSESNDELTKTVSTTCTSSTPTEKCSKQGNGYIKITLLSID